MSPTRFYMMISLCHAAKSAADESCATVHGGAAGNGNAIARSI